MSKKKKKNWRGIRDFRLNKIFHDAVFVIRSGSMKPDLNMKLHIIPYMPTINK